MDRNMRRGHDASFKARVAHEALKWKKPKAQLSSEHGVYSGPRNLDRASGRRDRSIANQVLRESMRRWFVD